MTNDLLLRDMWTLELYKHPLEAHDIEERHCIKYTRAFSWQMVGEAHSPVHALILQG